jgi:hypothetical protein
MFNSLFRPATKLDSQSTCGTPLRNFDAHQSSYSISSGLITPVV